MDQSLCLHRSVASVDSDPNSKAQASGPVQPHTTGTAVTNMLAIRGFLKIFPIGGMIFRAWKKKVFGKTKRPQLGFRQVYDFDQLQGRDARHVQDANLCICSCERAKV